MAMYDFQCECGFEFEKMKPSGTKTAECPSCGSDAERVFSGFGGFKFDDAEHLIDPGINSVDHWIGKDAEKRASAIEERQHQKKQLKHKHGEDVTLTRGPRGEYDVVEEDQEEEIKELHEFEEEFVEAVEEGDDVKRQD